MPWKASSVALMIAIAAAPARADPATPEGAEQLLEEYVAIFGREVADNGIVTVDPHGDAYRVTWHIRRALDLGDVPPAQFQIGDFAYEITPGAGGAWRLTADAFPSMAFDTPTEQGRMSGKVDVTGLNIDSSYDPARASPFASRSIFGDIAADLRILADGKFIPFHIDESGVQVDIKQTTTEAGANFALHETVGALVETMSVPIETQPNAKVDLTFKIGAAIADGTIDQFRSQQALSVWSAILAHKNEPDEASAAAVKTALAAGLPGWRTMKFSADLSDLSFDMSLARAHIKGLRETFTVPGFTETATGGFGLKIDEFDMHSPFLPEGFRSLLPLSLDFGLGVKFAGLDRIAKIALDDPEFMVQSGISPDGQAQIEQIFTTSVPTITLAPGYLRNPLIDIAYRGDVSVSPNAGLVDGHVVVSADTLDKVMDFVKPFVVLSPDVGKAVLAISAVKGMAKTGPDGRLVWDIEMTGPPRQQLTVNGVPIPIDR